MRPESQEPTYPDLGFICHTEKVSQRDDLSRFSTLDGIFPLPAASCAPHLVLSTPQWEGLYLGWRMGLAPFDAHTS